MMAATTFSDIPGAAPRIATGPGECSARASPYSATSPDSEQQYQSSVAANAPAALAALGRYVADEAGVDRALDDFGFAAAGADFSGITAETITPVEPQLGALRCPAAQALA